MATPQTFDLGNQYRGDTITFPLISLLTAVGDILDSGTLTNATLYLIKRFRGSDDFSNIGATNETNNIFTSTGTTPTKWTCKSQLQEVTRVDLTGATVDCEFYDKDGALVKTISEVDGITVGTGTISIDNFIPTWQAGMTKADVQVTFPDGTVKTYAKIRFNLIQDLT